MSNEHEEKEINITNIRDFASAPHFKCDDEPFGGGAGMVMMCEPVFNAVEAIRTEDSHVIILTPRGKTYNQQKAYELTNKKHLIIESTHPSPFSARNGFFGSKPFSRTNEFLKKNKIKEVNFTLPNHY